MQSTNVSVDFRVLDASPDATPNMVRVVMDTKVIMWGGEAEIMLCVFHHRRCRHSFDCPS
jgi:hypothetical protein